MADPDNRLAMTETAAAVPANAAEKTPVKSDPRCPAHVVPYDVDDHAPVISNIESFVASTTPLVPARGSGSALEGGHFALADLWSSFDEMSAYGVEVPLVLDADEAHKVFQYYVPFLSGLQIFRAAEVNPGDGDGDGDGGLVPDGKTSSSSRVPRDDGPPVVMPSGVGAATRRGEDVPGRELVFQFFEQASPYSRPPLADTLATLAETEPSLATASSADLHPDSWMSIAWYPIYRIPVGRSLRDLSACFLTYHALSTAEKEKTPEGVDGEEKGRGASGCPEPPPASALGEAAVSARANQLTGADPSGHPRIGLRAFGMSYYKLRGELWQAADVADWLGKMTEGAHGWLRRLKVIHPDFEFFSQHG